MKGLEACKSKKVFEMWVDLERLLQNRWKLVSKITFLLAKVISKVKILKLFIFHVNRYLLLSKVRMLLLHSRIFSFFSDKIFFHKQSCNTCTEMEKRNTWYLIAWCVSSGGTPFENIDIRKGCSPSPRQKFSPLMIRTTVHTGTF